MPTKNEKLNEYLGAVRTMVRGMPAIMADEPLEEWLVRIERATARMKESDPKEWAAGLATYAFFAGWSPAPEEGDCRGNRITGVHQDNPTGAVHGLGDDDS